jgi:L-iditol 2-dehydrogenase
VNGVPLREGDRITFLDVHRTCNACWYCLVAKASTRCPQRKVYGISYGADDVLAGGWAEKMYMKPGTRLIPLGKASSEHFMAGGCSLPTSMHAIERAEIRIGQTVLVLGSGPVGLSAVILAGLSGAYEVLCIGAADRRLAAARAVGAAHTLNFEGKSEDERVHWVRELTGGRGADITIEATGVPAAVVDAMRYTRDAGRVVVVGQYTDHGEVSFNPHSDLNRKHLEVRGVWGFDFSHMYRGVQVMQDRGMSAAWSRIVMERYSLGDADRALEKVERGEVVKALIDPAL